MKRLTCIFPPLLQDSPAPAPAVDSVMVAAAMVVLVMVAVSPSPQSQQPVALGECIKDESSPSSYSKNLEYALLWCYVIS